MLLLGVYIWPESADLNKDGNMSLEERELFRLSYATTLAMKQVMIYDVMHMYVYIYINRKACEPR